jgi:hypothetical protein
MQEGVRHRSKALRDSLRAQLAALAADVDATRRDAGFQEALRTMAAFWRYSPVNQFLIRTQRRGPRARA